MNNKKYPLVSLTIPTYNRPKWLKNALECAINQTYKNIEIILSDNCSEDPEVDKICKEYASKYPQIKHYRQESNIGAGLNGDFCVSKSTGKYIMGLCDDDSIAPTYIEKTLNKILSDKNAVFCWTKINLIDENNNQVTYTESQEKHDSPDLTDKNTVNNLIKWYMVYSWVGIGLFKAESFKNIDWNYKKSCGFDIHVIAQLILKGTIVKVEESLYTYRTRSQACYEYRSYTTDPSYNEYCHINPYLDLFLRIFEFVFETNKLNIFQKIEFYLKFYYNVFFKDRTWIDSRIYLFPITKFINKLIKKSDIKSLLILTPLFINIACHKIKKFQLKTPFLYLYRKFRYVRKNSIALIESNSCHGETLPSYIKYFNKLGYKVDIFLGKNFIDEKLLDNIDRKKNKIYKITHKILKTLIKLNKFIKYKHIVFNTSVLYSFKNDKGIDVRIENIYNFNPKNLITVEHNINNITKEKLSKDNFIMLYNFKENKMVNPHYFQEVSCKNKNEKTKFVVIGNIDHGRRNYDLLIKVVQQLIERGYENFEVNIIGALFETFEVPDEFLKYIAVKGRLNFPDMYREIENSDFILPLLDIKNPEHVDYIQNKVTGSYQLSLGFLKPMIINETFANFYNLNEKNAITYKANELTNAIEKGILIDNDNFLNLQKNIIILKENIEEKSIENLRKVLTKNQL